MGDNVARDNVVRDNVVRDNVVRDNVVRDNVVEAIYRWTHINIFLFCSKVKCSSP